LRNRPLADRQTDRQSDRQTDRQSDRQANKQIDANNNLLAELITLHNEFSNSVNVSIENVFISNVCGTACSLYRPAWSLTTTMIATARIPGN